MFVTRFKIKNYMIHADTEVGLYPITVFVGLNNAGKSALFDALLNFSMVSRGRLHEAFQAGPYSFESRKNHGASGQATIGYEVDVREASDSNTSLRYRVAFKQIAGGGYVISSETLEGLPDSTVLFDRADVDASPMKSVIPLLADDRSVLAAVRRVFVTGEYGDVDHRVLALARDVSRIGRFRLDPVNLARPSALPEPSLGEGSSALGPRLMYRGEGLATVLYHLQETESPVLDRIKERAGEVIDGFEDFILNVTGTDRVGFSVKFADARGSVYAANLSDGTLSVLGLLALLYSPSRPPVLCIEEPENGLTPRATRALYDVLKEVSVDAETPTQILLSSHSPFVICEAWNGEDREFIYQVEPQSGKARVQKVTDILASQGVHLRRKGGERVELGLRQADLVMGGFYS